MAEKDTKAEAGGDDSLCVNFCNKKMGQEKQFPAWRLACFIFILGRAEELVDAWLIC